MRYGLASAMPTIGPVAHVSKPRAEAEVGGPKDHDKGQARGMDTGQDRAMTRGMTRFCTTCGPYASGSRWSRVPRCVRRADSANPASAGIAAQTQLVWHANGYAYIRTDGPEPTLGLWL